MIKEGLDPFHITPCLVQVVSFAGDLLSSAEGLLRDGLHTSEVAEGYTKAATKAGQLSFPCLSFAEVSDLQC